MKASSSLTLTSCGAEQTDHGVFGDCLVGVNRKRREQKRHGLAPVELVISLPILLFVMALIMIFGTAATWKVRTETIARDTVWRTRTPRYRHLQPQPVEWPEGVDGENSASHSVHSGNNVSALIDDRIRKPVVVGPLDGITVNQDILDFRRGVRVGVGNLTRKPPLMRKFSTYDFRVDNHLIEDEFQYHRMGIGNRTRRMPRIYEFNFPGGLESQYQSAIQAIDTNPRRYQLKPLDNDEEFLTRPPDGGGIPDFHPGVQGSCSLDVELAERNVKRAVGRVEGVPERMANAYIGLYQAWLDYLIDTHPSRAYYEARIEELEEFKAQLEEDEEAEEASATRLEPEPLQ